MNSEQEERGSSASRLSGRACVLCTLHSALCTLLLCLLAPSAALAADEPPPSPAPLSSATELANANTVALLAAARDALHKLNNPHDADHANQRKIYFDTAVDCFTALYQLHGCDWAAPELRRLYARPDAPQLRLGYSADGRVLLRAEPLELLNPVYDDYCILLCSFGSHTARDYSAARQGSLRLTLPDGQELAAEQLTAAHPLWDSLERLAGQYAAPQELPSGSGIAFKQLYAIPRAELPLNHCALSLDWGGYHFELPRWVNAPAGASDGSDG